MGAAINRYGLEESGQQHPSAIMLSEKEMDSSESLLYLAGITCYVIPFTKFHS